jgi:hypothetical protein
LTTWSGNARPSWERQKQDDAIERLDCLQKSAAAIEGTEAEYAPETYRWHVNMLFIRLRERRN